MCWVKKNLVCVQRFHASASTPSPSSRNGNFLCRFVRLPSFGYSQRPKRSVIPMRNASPTNQGSYEPTSFSSSWFCAGNSSRKVLFPMIETPSSATLGSFFGASSDHGATRDRALLNCFSKSENDCIVDMLNSAQYRGIFASGTSQEVPDRVQKAQTEFNCVCFACVVPLAQSLVSEEKLRVQNRKTQFLIEFLILSLSFLSLCHISVPSGFSEVSNDNSSSIPGVLEELGPRHHLQDKFFPPGWQHSTKWLLKRTSTSSYPTLSGTLPFYTSLE